MIDVSMQVYDVVNYLYASVFANQFVRRVEYNSLLRVAADMYRENLSLRTRLRDLERLASSWTGTPERNVAIVRAREALRNQA
jgi:hypothetical protein